MRHYRTGQQAGLARPAAAMTAAAIAGSAACAAVAYLTGWHALLALPAGAAVGWTTSRPQVASRLPLRAAGAALAVAACALGTLLAEIAILAARHGTGMSVIIAHPGIVVSACAGAVGWNALFWAAAALLGAIPPARSRRAACRPPQAQQHPAQPWAPRAAPRDPGADMTALTSPRPGQPPSLASYIDAPRTGHPATEPWPQLPPDAP